MRVLSIKENEYVFDNNWRKAGNNPGWGAHPLQVSLFTLCHLSMLLDHGGGGELEHLEEIPQ